jgi:hypothetical protein
LLERWPRWWGVGNLFATAAVGNDAQRKKGQSRSTPMPHFFLLTFGDASRPPVGAVILEAPSMHYAHMTAVVRRLAPGVPFGEGLQLSARMMTSLPPTADRQDDVRCGSGGTDPSARRRPQKAEEITAGACIGTDDAAASAHHARTKRWHWHVIGPRVRAHDRPLVALPARHVERPHTVGAHVAEDHGFPGADRGRLVMPARIPRRPGRNAAGLRCGEAQAR